MQRKQPKSAKPLKERKTGFLSEHELHHHIDIYSNTCPEVALFLPYVDSSHLKPCTTAAGELNIQKEGHPYHSSENASKEASAWFASLNLHNIDILYVYGIGLGYYYAAAQQWLKGNHKRRMIFLEDDPAVILQFFRTPLCTQLLNDPQASIYDISRDDAKWIFDTLQWEFAGKPFLISALAFYAEDPAHATRWQTIQQKIPHDAARMHIVMKQLLNYGVDFYEHFYLNTHELPLAKLGNHLFGKFKNIPAIICGAGPSLQNNVQQLKAVGDKALILAGGSGLNALIAHGVIPHFGAAIDPFPAETTRLQQTANSLVPLFYNSCLRHTALQTIQGQRLYTAQCKEYPVVGWLEKQLKMVTSTEESQQIDEGYGVINFLTSIAQRLGCNPIVFVGMDLAFTDMKLYSNGVIDDPTITIKELASCTNIADKPQHRKSIHDKEILTDWRWIWESEWTSQFATDHPEIQFINATENGLGFKDIPNKTLSSLIKHSCVRNFHLRNKVWEELQKIEPMHIGAEEIIESLKQLHDSLERAKRLLTMIVEGIEQDEMGKITLAEHELIAEPAYNYLLAGFHQILNKMHAKELNQAASTRGQEKEKRELQYRIYAFLITAAHTHADLITKDLLALSQASSG